jgi:CheY-like chemotaxis protein
METNRSASILILDDNDALRRILVRTLSAAGYSVVDTGDPNEAMRLLSGGTAFDLLIADIQMPGLQPHGINVGNMAMHRPHGPKVIYITGDPSQVPSGFVDEAKTPVLGKPIRSEALLAAVKGALAARH